MIKVDANASYWLLFLGPYILHYPFFPCFISVEYVCGHGLLVNNVIKPYSFQIGTDHKNCPTLGRNTPQEDF